MLLSAFLKLDASGFTTTAGKVLEGTKFLTRSFGEFSAKLKTGFDLGGGLSDLATQLDISAGKVLVMQQVFDDAGVGAGNLAGTMNLMRRALGGVSESGEPTNKMFARLGLSIDDLKKMDATQQFKTIGDAIGELGDPAERASVAMGIFGRSGATLQTIFADKSALETATKRLGGLPAIMDKNANAFDAVSDRIAGMKMKTTGFWAGMAAGVLPAADAITKALDGIDLSGLGQKVGHVLGAIATLFQTVPLGELLWTGVKAAGEQVVQWVGKAFAGLGGWISSVWGESTGALGNMLSGVFDFIAEMLPRAFEMGWTAFKVLGGEAVNWAVTGVMMIGEWLGESLAKAWQWCTELFDKAWAGITSSLGGAGGTLMDGLKDAITWLWDSLKLTGSIIWDSIKLALGKVANAIAKLFGKNLFDLAELEEGLSDKLGESLVGKAAAAVGDAIDSVGKWTENVTAGYNETGKATIFDTSKDKEKLGGQMAGYFGAIGDNLVKLGDGRNTGVFQSMFSDAMAKNTADADAIANTANASGGWGGKSVDLAGKKGGGGGNDILSDQLARIGGRLGAIGNDSNRNIERTSEQTAKNTQEMLKVMRNGISGGQPAAVFA